MVEGKARGHRSIGELFRGVDIVQPELAVGVLIILRHVEQQGAVANQLASWSIAQPVWQTIDQRLALLRLGAIAQVEHGRQAVQVQPQGECVITGLVARCQLIDQA
ncbi:hypothetical protein D3C80_1760420 [compost metagenome]